MPPFSALGWGMLRLSHPSNVWVLLPEAVDAEAWGGAAQGGPGHWAGHGVGCRVRLTMASCVARSALQSLQPISLAPSPRAGLGSGLCGLHSGPGTQ